jgi:cell division protease FtsH
VTYETPRKTLLGEDSLAHYADREFSKETARQIDCAVCELVGDAYEKALAVLRQNRRALDEGARLLLEKETLSREELPPLAEIRLAAA